jgi:hypothetical protein
LDLGAKRISQWTDINGHAILLTDNGASKHHAPIQ